jgi:hypothetical protein
VMHDHDMTEPTLDDPLEPATFYLGSHQPAWLTRALVPLFISHRRLVGYRRLPRPRAGWALDSGGSPACSDVSHWAGDGAHRIICPLVAMSG